MNVKIIAALIVSLIGSTVLVSGCRFGHHGDIRGSGVRQTQTRDVNPFKSIYSEGVYEIEIVCQKEQSLQLEGDDNILPLIKTEVTGSVLRISSTKSFSPKNNVRIKIAVPDLEGLSSTGAGTFDVKGLKSEKFAINLTGASTINVAGNTKDLSVDVSGAGKIDTHKLHASKVTVDSKGVSNVEVYAGDKLDVTISGPSHVIYYGDPEVNQTINGPGSLEKRESEGA